MNIWHDIDPALITPDRFMAVIEIKRGGKNKYEMDKETGLIIPAGRFILMEAAKMCCEIRQFIAGFQMNINVSFPSGIFLRQAM